MVYKEIIECDVCGKELTLSRRRGAVCNEVSITMHKTLAEVFGLKGIVHPRVRRYGRRSYFTVNLDVCSKECLMKILYKIDGAIPESG